MQIFKQRDAIFQNFKEQGYVTGISRDYCENFNPENGAFNTLGAAAHHEGYAQSCDLEYSLMNYRAERRCLYSKNGFEYTLDYGT